MIFYVKLIGLFYLVSCKSDTCIDSLKPLISEWNNTNIRTSENFEFEVTFDTINIYIYEISEFGSKALQDLTITDLSLSICELDDICFNKPIFLHYVLPSSQFENSTVSVKKSKEIKIGDCNLMIKSLSKDKRNLLKYIVKNFSTDDEVDISYASKVLSRLYTLGDSTVSGLTTYFNYLNLDKTNLDLESNKAYWNVIALNKIIQESGVNGKMHLDSINHILDIRPKEIDWNELELKLK